MPSADGTSQARRFKVHLGHLALVYLAFATLVLISGFFAYSERTALVDGTFADGAVIGPLSFANADTVLEVTVAKAVPDQSWAFVELEVQDAGGSRLFSLGEEMWHATDPDGRRPGTEVAQSIVGHIVLPTAGQYRFVLWDNGPAGAAPTQTTVRIDQKGGSTLLFWVAGITALLIAAIAAEMHGKVFGRIVCGRTHGDCAQPARVRRGRVEPGH